MPKNQIPLQMLRINNSINIALIVFIMVLSYCFNIYCLSKSILKLC